MTAKSLAILAGALWLLDSGLAAQTVTKAQSVTGTATIQAIDTATRMITLRKCSLAGRQELIARRKRQPGLAAVQ